MKDFLILMLLSTLCWVLACEQPETKSDQPSLVPPPPSFAPPPLGLVPTANDTIVHAVMGVMEGFYAISVEDSIVGLTEATSEDEGALIFSTRDRGQMRVERIGDLNTFVIKVPVAFAGQNLVVQISNMSPCASDPFISYGTPIPPDGLVYVDVSPETVPFMDFYVTGFLPPIHGQYWRLSRTFE